MHAAVLWTGLIVEMFAYMTLWYGIALYTKRYDVVDSAWGLGFVLVAWVSVAMYGHLSTVTAVSIVLVSLWGLRLFGHLGNRNWRRHEDDRRYQALRAQWGVAAHSKAYTNIFLLQGALMLLVSLPVVAIILADRRTVNAGIILGWLVWLGGIITEAVADAQLARFIKARPAGSHAVMTAGLWRYSRHPNYFGEITAWWGAAIVAYAAGAWWGVLGALSITVLITKVSGIPPLEKRYAGDKEYAAYRARTSVLLPLPPKKPGQA